MAKIDLRNFFRFYKVVTADASTDRAVAFVKADPHRSVVEVDDLFSAH